MKILITGCCGYIGYPLTIELSKSKHTIIGVDNRSRTRWVENTTGKFELEEFENYIEGNLTNPSFVNELLAIHKPDIIIHLASQPSMPYSQLNGERALFTQTNNLSMLVNILWGMKEIVPNAKLILTTTTGIPGQGYKEIPESNTLNMAGSWYHTSRGFDSANCSLASRQWNLNILELRTSIVYGIQTELMVELGLITRFDTDPYFGTVLNRFIKQAMDKKPITIYGKGEQTKPFISLEDTVQSLVNASSYEAKGHEIFNQTTENVSIKQLASIISKYTRCEVSHIPNPRKENETHKMTFINKKFLKLLDKKPKLIDRGIKELIHYFGRTRCVD